MVVSLDEIKAYYKIQQEWEEDELLERLSQQAQAAAEDFCRVSFDDTAPQPVRLAIMLMIGHYYENRGGADRQAYQPMRMAFENLLYPYRDPDMIF